jgi:hypothetical protein
MEDKDKVFSRGVNTHPSEQSVGWPVSYIDSHTGIDIEDANLIGKKVHLNFIKFFSHS